MPDNPSSAPIKKSSPTNANDIAIGPNSIKLRLFFWSLSVVKTENVINKIS